MNCVFSSEAVLFRSKPLQANRSRDNPLMRYDRDSHRAGRASRVRTLTAAAMLGVALFGGGASAGTVEVSYTITLAGISIGKASLAGSVSNESYTLNLSAALTGLVGAVTKGSGTGTSRGGFGSMPLTNGFSMQASNGTVTRTIQFSAASGSIRSVAIDPPLEIGPEGRVPLQPQHRANVLDPLSALVMPSKGADPLDKANCERRLPVFDGTARFDVVLSYIGVRNVKAESGYSGPALVCAARYVPIAGHRPDRRAIKFMQENRDMSAWLVPVNNGSALMPYRISVRTMIGTSVIEARRFVASPP
jgi:Protein of unknown function (DUF3108)